MKVTTLVLLVSGVVVARQHKARRGKIVPRHRLEWVPHREGLLLEGQFKRYYRMSAEAFGLLAHLLAPALKRVTIKPENRSDIKPIEVVNMVQMTISWLAGGSFHTIRVLAGVSISAFYDIVLEVMNALCNHKRFRIVAPINDPSAMRAASDAFASISSNAILTGCIGCIDGWLSNIRAPSSKKVPDVSAFFSGHYLTYGINVQALCDASCRFIGYCLNSPGKVSDSVAFSKWKLSAEIANLPFGYYVVGDNAYILASSMLTPFTKPEMTTPLHSDYNFYISQLRIRIEMSFGLLVNKWRIFQRSLKVDYVHTGLVIKTCMKLHSYCIDDRIRTSLGSSSTVVLREYNTLEKCSYQATVDTSAPQIKVKNGHLMRRVLMEHIQDYNMARP